MAERQHDPLAATLPEIPVANTNTNTNTADDAEARAVMRDSLREARRRLLACPASFRLSPAVAGEVAGLQEHLRALSERVERGPIG